MTQRSTPIDPKDIVDSGPLVPHPMPEGMAKTLEAAIATQNTEAYTKLDEGQKIFLQNWLFALSSYATELTEEKRRMTGGGLPVRSLPKSSSYGLASDMERKLYTGVLDGSISAEEAKKQFSPQDIVYTTHPNFSATPEMAILTQDALKSFLKISPTSLGEIAKDSGKIGPSLQKELAACGLNKIFSKALEELKPRKHRNRAEELEEAAIDLVPNIYKGLVEEVAIISKRGAMVDVPAFKSGKNLSYKQVTALAQMTSDHSTWFSDGDGKRTSHAWDNDYALPAIKAAAMKEFLASLKKIKKDVEGTSIQESVNTQINGLEANLVLVQKFTQKARDRMIALTKLQAYADAHGESVVRDEISDELLQLRKEVQRTGVAYQALRNDSNILNALSTDYSAPILKLAEEMKGMESQGTLKISHISSSFDAKSSLSELDALIIKSSKGDFPMKIERRENANQHKEAMRYFLKTLSNAGVAKELFGRSIPGMQPPQLLTKDDFADAMRATTAPDEQCLRKVMEVIDDLATKARYHKEQLNSDDIALAAHISNVLETSYKTAANSIEPNYATRKDRMPLELPSQESVFLDDVSPFYISGKLYKDAYKRLIIAEAGSPPNTMLAKGKTKPIREEAMLRDNNDVLTVNIFKNLLGSNVDVVPLYEDPDAILHTPAMLATKLSNRVYHNALGIDLAQADSKVMRKANGSEVTAYAFLQSQGFSDDIMQARKLDIAALKQASVYVGPHKMLANSDSAKRGTLAASILNQISIVESYEAAAHHMIDNKGKKMLYVNQIYVGQGGSLARTTGADALINTVTEQGQHPTFSAGIYSSMKSVLRSVTRLVSKGTMSGLSDNEPTGLHGSAHPRIALETMALGNPYGFKLDLDTMGELKKRCMKAIRVRINGTRDDIKVPGTGNNGDGPNTRYEELLRKYGEDFIENYSARPASKGGKVDFVGIRAIGLGGKEFGFFSNIVGVSEMFKWKDEKLVNLSLMAKLYENDPTVKHNFDAAAYTACLSEKTLPYVWSKGNITLSKNNEGAVLLKKGDQEVSLAELTAAYKSRATEYKHFDAADLALANIHQQTELFVAGLAQIRSAVALGANKKGQYMAGPISKVRDPIELIPEHLQSTVEHARGLAEQMTAFFRAMEAKPAVVENMKKNAKKPDNMLPDAKSLRMGKDAYYQLMETSLEQQALSRVKYTSRAA